MTQAINPSIPSIVVQDSFRSWLLTSAFSFSILNSVFYILTSVFLHVRYGKIELPFESKQAKMQEQLQDSTYIHQIIANGSRPYPASSTDEYLYSQLIPYIGNKRNLLWMICKAIEHTGLIRGSFVDLFAGSGVVSRLAKILGFAVISNDWEPYSEFINRCWIECNHTPEFSDLGGIEQAFEQLNNLHPVEGYVSRHLCPLDDENPDPDHERMFFTRANGMRIDAMRETILDWENRGLISEDEKSVLLAPLIYSVSYTSNTSGVFKGFHRGWGGATKTALYRILSTLTLREPVFYDNGCSNTVYRMDAAELVESLPRTVDIAYLDPPYNQHPYGSNYHVLNTVALWDKPPVSRMITCKDKAAIRKDWRTKRRSAYNKSSTAIEAFGQLIELLDARYILISYSTDGVMPLDELLSCAANKGKLDIVVQPYKRYRVSTQRMSRKPVNAEFVLVIDTSEHGSKLHTVQIRDRIMQTEEQALSQHPETV